MTEYNDPYNSSHVVEIDDTDYLVQGKIDDPLTMFRPVKDLLECEKDNVRAKMLESYDGRDNR